MNGEITHETQDQYKEECVNKWVQVGFNACIAGGTLFLLSKILTVIHHDVQWKLKQQQLDDQQYIATCARNYKLNRCDPSTRVPALSIECEKWFDCMQLASSPSAHEISVLWATTLAQVLNALVEQISFKTVIVLLLCVVSLILARNIVFSSYKIYHVRA